jgi:hypothetical protein
MIITICSSKYSLIFRYSKVLTGDRSARARNSVTKQNKNDLNPEIKKYKNGEEARKEST